MTLGKYSTEMHMSNESDVRVKILKAVKPNSTVLEFGPACGVMTKHLKEVLGCEVYIVEINEEDFTAAMEYAVDGVCGDATRLEWENRFFDVRFDYVIFADVLEHVYEPEVLLGRAAAYLKEGGRILLSVPNIAHNSIIINLLKDRFEYKQVGLLDNSHIRFFTYNGLLEMLDRQGLKPAVEDAVYLHPLQTEFADNYDYGVGKSQMLKNKPNGYVYQFVFEAVKKDVEVKTERRILSDNQLAFPMTPASWIKFLAYRAAPFRLMSKFVVSVKRNGIKAAMQTTFDYLRMNQLHKKIKTQPQYRSNYQENVDFSSYSTSVKALAFYLPQFHQIPENDRWWGEGFTEWTNTRKALPRFEGHYQPRTPHRDIGYYSLDLVETVQAQAELAKSHGVYGFCFYYYWFSGRRLLEKPVDLLLESPQIDMPFCLCWANDNWSRRWDASENEILVEQLYAPGDAARFIADLKQYVDDPRYIRIDGKPIIIVYNPSAVPSAKVLFEEWRAAARITGIGEILIWVCETYGRSVDEDSIVPFINAIVDFPPFWPCRGISKVLKYEGTLFDYSTMVKSSVENLKDKPKTTSIPRYRTTTLGWDNTPRRKVGFLTAFDYSLEDFYEWCYAIKEYAERTYDEKNRFMFINAWNEWAEGTYLEPDEKYGYANINTFSKALYGLPLEGV